MRYTPPTTSEMLTFIASKITDHLEMKRRIESVRCADRVSQAAAIGIVYRSLRWN